MVSVSQMTCTINKHLGPLREIGPLFNKPAPGIQTVFETIFHSFPDLPLSTGPFYIWHPVAKAALRSHRHLFGRCWEAGPAAPASAVRCCGVGGCGEPTQAASPAPLPENPQWGRRGTAGGGQAHFPCTVRQVRWEVIAAQEHQGGLQVPAKVLPSQ